MIRPTQTEEIPRLVELARGTGVFKPVELTALQEVLADYATRPGGGGYHCYTYDLDGQVSGFVCHGPNSMTDRTWDLYWIVVAKPVQGKGIGTKLLRFVEEDVQRHNGRLLIIETCSLPSYEPTRRFYRKHGYEQVAEVKDFYADGDALLIFRKRLAPERS